LFEVCRFADLIPVVMLFELTPIELTPKALANFSPGLERSDNPGNQK